MTIVVRSTAAILTEASFSQDEDRKPKRIGVVIASWFAVDVDNRKSLTFPPPWETKTAVIDASGKMHYVRESFQDVAALLGAAEGETR